MRPYPTQSKPSPSGGTWILVRRSMVCAGAALLLVPLGQALSAEPAPAPELASQLAFEVRIQQPPYAGSLRPAARTPEAMREADMKRHATQAAVADHGVQLQIYGPCAKQKTGVEVWGTPGTPVPLNLWTGLCRSPVAVIFKDTRDYVDLSGSARVRWVTRTAGLHAIRPVLRLADGTLLVGSYAYSSPAQPRHPDMAENEFYIAPTQWYRLDPQTVTTRDPVARPDLSKVDGVGFADLMPGGGHGLAGWVNLSELEVFGKKVPR